MPEIVETILDLILDLILNPKKAILMKLMVTKLKLVFFMFMEMI